MQVSRTIGTALLVAVAGCGGGDRPAGSIVVRDAGGREVRLGRPAERVISLIPSVTDVVLALGAGDRLVARTDYDTHPSLRALPSVGGGLTPSLEWLASREPDLVVAWPDATSRSVVTRLDGMGVAVYTASSETVADALAVIRDMGRLLGAAASADSVAWVIEDGFDAVRAAVAGRPEPSVLYLIGRDPIMAAGAGTFVSELIVVAGGRNVLEGIDILWPQVALEEVLRRDPDVLVVAQAPAERDLLERLRREPGWRTLEAVRSGRVYQVDPYLFNRPAPSMVDAAWRLAELIHGVSRRDPAAGGATPGPSPSRELPSR